MNKEREFIIKITAKDAMDFSGKSLSTAKRWIKEHEFDMVERSVEKPVNTVSVDESEKSWSVERSVENKTEEPQYVEPVYDWQQMVERKVETPTYTPTPVEPTVYPEQSKFDFAQMASQTLNDNKPETKSDYWKRLRASMGDVD